MVAEVVQGPQTKGDVHSVAINEDRLEGQAVANRVKAAVKEWDSPMSLTQSTLTCVFDFAPPNDADATPLWARSRSVWDVLRFGAGG